MTKLNQILAIEQGTKARTNKTITDSYHKIQKVALFTGITRRYHPRDAENGEQLPPENTNVQASSEKMLEETFTAFKELINITSTKDVTNTLAKAAIVVDGVTVAQEVPATHILWLEKQLTDVHTFISKLPVLDPGENWTYDSNAASYKTDEKISIRNKKVMKNHVKVEATDKFPAQVDVYTEDVPVGEWHTFNFSGAMPADRQRALLLKVEKLQDATRKAREAANLQEVTDINVGTAIIDWLLA